MSQPKISGLFKRMEPFETVETEEQNEGPVSKKLCPNTEHDDKNIYIYSFTHNIIALPYEILCIVGFSKTFFGFLIKYIDFCPGF